jgi:hypothetical protein
MSRPAAKLNVASLDRPPPAIDTPADPVNWVRIEALYGNAIPPSARAQIVQATNKFLEFSAFALAARSISEALNRVDAVKHHAADLMGALCDQPESMVAIDRSIEGHLMRLGAINPQSLASIIDALSCLIAACAKTKQDLTTKKSNGLRVDEHWRHWVRRIGRIAEEHDLPTGVRKDRVGYTAWKPSPFVQLIDALQASVPPKHRRLGRAEPATKEPLSQAIVLARNEYKRLTRSGR